MHQKALISSQAFLLEESCYPINQPTYRADQHSIHNHRPGDGKHFGPSPKMNPSAAVKLGHSRYTLIYLEIEQVRC